MVKSVNFFYAYIGNRGNMTKIFDWIEENWKEFIVFFLIFILAIVLRIITIQNYGSLDQDEPYSWRFANQSSVLEVIKTVIGVDIHMPLYFILLHFWIKIFGDSYVSLHFSSFVFALPLLPLVYFIAKDLFNKKTAFFSMLFLSVSTFCIYYSTFTRFYSLIFPLSIALAYFFVKMLEDFDKKFVVGFIITHTLLFYTFNLTCVLSFFYAVFGLAYVLYKRENIQQFICVYLLTFLLSIPGVFLIISNIFALKNSICSHGVEFFYYDIRCILDILENFFSNENYQLMTKYVADYRNILENIKNKGYFLSVFIPILIGLFGLIKTLFSKNSKLYLFLLPSLFTIVAVILLSKYNLMYYQTKYLCIVLPVIIISMIYGLSTIKNAKIFFTIALLLVSLNFTYVLPKEKNILNYQNAEVDNFDELMDMLEVTDEDMVMSLFVPDVVKMFYHKGATISLAFDEALLIKDKTALEFYFGTELFKQVNSNNIVSVLLESTINDIPLMSYEKNLYNIYLKNMKKGQKFIIFNPYEPSTGRIEERWDLDYENYKNYSKFIFVMTKAYRDTYLIADKYLKLIDIYRNDETGSSIYYFVKE